MRLGLTEITSEDEAALAGTSAERRTRLNTLLFPGPTAEFAQRRELFGDLSVLDTSDYLYGLVAGQEHMIEIDRGVQLYVGIEAIGEADDKGMRTVMTTLNGQLRPVFVRDRSIVVDAHEVEKADTSVPGQVAAPFSGVVTLKAEVGAAVRAGEPVASIEAMKMEAAITAPVDGVIERHAIAEDAAGGCRRSFGRDPPRALTLCGRGLCTMCAYPRPAQAGSEIVTPKNITDPDESPLGVLDEAASLDTAGIGILGGTAQVSVTLPKDEDDDLTDDGVVEGEVVGDLVIDPPLPCSPRWRPRPRRSRWPRGSPPWRRPPLRPSVRPPRRSRRSQKAAAKTPIPTPVRLRRRSKISGVRLRGVDETAVEKPAVDEPEPEAEVVESAVVHAAAIDEAPVSSASAGPSAFGEHHRCRGHRRTRRHRARRYAGRRRAVRRGGPLRNASSPERRPTPHRRPLRPCPPGAVRREGEQVRVHSR